MNLSIEIIPIHELKNAFNIDGYVSNNFKTITVDQYVFENIENRYRFTLAHEIGHIILHKPIFEQLGFTNEEEWKYMITAFDTKQYGNLETQANRFAALILVPGHHLIEKYNDAINKVELEGFDRKENSELFIEFVCRWLGQIFRVSSKTIEYRLKADRLI